MAENTNNMLNATKMDRREVKSSKNASRLQPNLAARSKTDFLSKEEEYKRLNEELEAKTASLVQEAEEVMRGQESILAKSRLLDNINTDDFFKEFEQDLLEENAKATHKSQSRPTSITGHSGETTSHHHKSGEAIAHSTRPKSGKKKSASKQSHSRPISKTSAAEDVAIPEESFMTEFKEAFSYRDAFVDIEGQMEMGEIHGAEDEDVLPQGAQDMGSEAVIRFMKAKLRVMQEELDRLSQENNKKEEEKALLKGRLKELEEERGRLHRTNVAQQNQMEKYKKLAEEARSKSDSQETQLTAVRKELEQLKRGQKQQQSTQSVTEVRLNRALEEIERYKDQLQKAKTSSKDSADVDKKRVEQLLAENKRLEKQKNELMAGFKKQMKLIDILKRQKMHIEAAKMLQFSEEEFVKALEWGS